MIIMYENIPGGSFHDDRFAHPNPLNSVNGVTTINPPGITVPEGFVPPTATPERPKRTGRLVAIWAVIFTALVTAVGVTVVLALGDTPAGKVITSPFKDSGVAACESIRDNYQARKAGGTTAKTDYVTVRAAFADSRYEDLNRAGTHVVDLLKQTEGDDSGAVALVTINQIVAGWADLSGACSNHGVDIPTFAELSKLK